jgi:anti-anti-sigma factor
MEKGLFRFKASQALYGNRGPGALQSKQHGSSMKSETKFDLLQLRGEVDLHYSSKLREEIMDSLKDGRPLLIDMTDVSHIDSSAVASLVEGFQIAR